MMAEVKSEKETLLKGTIQAFARHFLVLFNTCNCLQQKSGMSFSV
jgi:hypothetical protein